MSRLVRAAFRQNTREQQRLQCANRSPPALLFKIQAMRRLHRGGSVSRKQGSEDPPQDPEVLACGVLFRAFTATFKEIERALLGTGITAPQVYALRFLKSGPSPMTPGRLADSLAQESQAVTGLLDRLEEQGWVYRVRDLPDRRSRRLELTDAGAQKLTEAQAAGDPAMILVLSGLTTEEVQQLGGLLERLRSSAQLRLGRANSRAHLVPP
jgi:MarR family transcriptional regulator, transcriptional regulator for hemolysin